MQKKKKKGGKKEKKLSARARENSCLPCDAFRSRIDEKSTH